MLVDHLLAPKSGINVQQLVGTLREPIMAPRLAEAWQSVTARHDALRTRFRWEELDTPVQEVLPRVELTVHFEDWGHLAPESQDERLRDFLDADRRREFRLDEAPLHRVALFRRGPTHHELVWTFHHAMLDGRSCTLVLRELFELYEASLGGIPPTPLTPPPLQRHLAWLAQRDPRPDEAFWSRYLNGAVPLPPFGMGPDSATTEPAGAADAGGPTACLSREVTSRLNDLAVRHGLTLNTFVLGAWTMLLHRYTGASDIVFGAIRAGRNTGVEGAGSMIGLLINCVPVRVRIEPRSPVLVWLQGIRADWLRMREFEHAPLARIQEWIGHPRDRPFFHTLIVFEREPRTSLLRRLGGGWCHREFHTHQRNNFTAALSAFGGAELSLQLASHPGSFDGLALRRMLGHLTTLLEGMASGLGTLLGDLPMLTPAESHQLLVAWNPPADATPERHRLTGRFEDQAAWTPDAVALEFDGLRLTYRELDSRANQLAHHLRSRGVTRGSRVGVNSERSPEQIIALLAILKAGGAYVPLDPHYPRHRLAHMVSDGGLQFVVTSGDQALPAAIPHAAVPVSLEAWSYGEWPDTHPAIDGDPADPAYVIYTSGSTGHPKGVVIPHRAVIHYVAAAGDCYRLGGRDRILQFATLNFDASVEEIFPILGLGGTLVLRTPEMISSMSTFLRLCQEWSITVLGLPTAFWHELVAELEAQDLRLPASLRLVIIGGERAQPARVASWQRRVGDRVELINTYGPTEATVVATAYRIEPRTVFAGEIPIGRPLRHVRVHVLDPWDHPVPVGVPGELHIGGESLALGYLNQPELTAARFVPDPFSGTPGARLYRTGDQARWLRSGDLVFCGRTDQQVKLRGFRIEPAEIESALVALPGIRVAVVQAEARPELETELVAWIVPDPGFTPRRGTLRDQLAEYLPKHLIPARFIVIPNLPLTPGGKVDRPALTRTRAGELTPGDSHVDPRDQREAIVAEVWKAVLGQDRIGVHDDFFSLGGHSLRAIQLVTRLRPVLQREVPLRALFEFPTIAGLLGHLDSVGHRAILELPALVRRPHDLHPIPLSFAQQRLWFLDRLEGDSTAYHIPTAFRLRGPLDPAALHRALLAIVERHESLRTCFVESNGTPGQIVRSSVILPLPVTDLSNLSGEAQTAALELFLRSEISGAFDLMETPLLRVALVRLADDDHVFCRTFHHIVSDGWSIGVFRRELGELYGAAVEDRSPSLAPLAIQYPDFALWQRNWLRGAELQRQTDYWRQTLTDAPTLELPIDRPRPASISYAGGSLGFSISSPLAARLTDLHRSEGLTPFMSLLAVFQILLARYSNQTDFLVGTPIANRRHAELEPLIGFFANTLALRADLSGDPSFRQLLARVRRSALDAFEHQDLPFEKLVEELNPPRHPSRHPLFQVLFALQNAPAQPLALDGLEVQHHRLASTTTHFDLELHLWATPGAWAGHLSYSTALFDHPTIERFAGHFLTLLDSLLAQPDRSVFEADLLTPPERHQLLVEWNDTAADYPRDRCIHQLFEEQVARTPDAIAVVFEDASLTYRELDDRANHLARHLRALGVGPDVPVGLCLERSFDLVIGVLAILKAGGAYLPLDPALPPQRLRVILATAHTPVLLTRRSLLGNFDPATPEVGSLPAVLLLDDLDPYVADHIPLPAAPSLTPDQLAYVLFTSGSTGLPKGVEMPHRALVNLLHWHCANSELGPGHRTLQFASLGFDVSFTELFVTWLSGGALVLIQDSRRRDPHALLTEIRRQHVHRLFIPPVMLEHLAVAASATSVPLEIRELIIAGEQLRISPAIRAFLDRLPDCRLWNHYGPTETHVATACLLDDPPADWPLLPSIGKPIPNCLARILDSRGALQPVGIPGELWLGGVCLARGYRQRPDLTAERFLLDPFDATARLYRTGDLVRLSPDGTLEYLGRLDHQVKIRGNRVEPGEVEAVLATHPDLAGAAVIARREDGGEMGLRAFIVFREGFAIPIRQLREWLAQKLPDYMVPARFLSVPTIPLNPSGKVDRRGLQDLPGTELAIGTEFVPPRTKLECAIAAVWRPLLRREQVGLHDNFFDLGGHSLLAVQLVAQLQTRLGLRTPVSLIFRHPTLGACAEALAPSYHAPAAQRFLVPLRESPRTPPFFCIHPGGGQVLAYLALADLMDPGESLTGIEHPDLHPSSEPAARSIEELATLYRESVRAIQHHGPYLLGGWSLGGVIAFEMARQFQAEGQSVSFLALLDSTAPAAEPSSPRDPSEREFAYFLATHGVPQAALQPCIERARGTTFVAALPEIFERLVRSRALPDAMSLDQFVRFHDIYFGLLATARRYQPASDYRGRLHLFRRTERLDPGARAGGWARLCSGDLVIQDVPGDHDTMFHPPHVATLAGHLQTCLTEARRRF